jgi:hypothetical protein
MREKARKRRPRRVDSQVAHARTQTHTIADTMADAHMITQHTHAHSSARHHTPPCSSSCRESALGTVGLSFFIIHSFTHSFIDRSTGKAPSSGAARVTLSPRAPTTPSWVEARPTSLLTSHFSPGGLSSAGVLKTLSDGLAPLWGAAGRTAPRSMALWAAAGETLRQQ